MATRRIDTQTLTDIANAIRAKTGGTSAMTPAEMVAAIASIVSENKEAELLSYQGTGQLTGTYRNDVVETLIDYAFHNQKAVERIELPNLRSLQRATWGFDNCSALRTVFLPNVTGACSTRVFNYCTSLESFDAASGMTNIGGNMFSGCASLNLIVIRRSQGVVPLGNATVFSGTPFDNGGSGGTIYIPKALYDRLGTGTADYKAATNWSTYDGYGTITWAAIEGSFYETHYADGTPIE